MALKASSDGESFSSSSIIQAIQYATMMKTRGVNIVAINFTEDELITVNALYSTLRQVGRGDDDAFTGAKLVTSIR